MTQKKRARKSKKIDYKIGAFDFETDPFKHDRVPAPFSWGFYNGEDYTDYWGDDCVQAFIDFMDSLTEPHIIYAHNGGKFDFIFLMEYFKGDIRIVNGRVLEVDYGIHKLRDSYAILPVPLASSNEKQDIDYAKMEADVRDEHRAEIMEYLYHDCIVLHKMVTLFREEFGDRLTIGGTAMNELKEFHPFEPVGEMFDERIRPFYFGGRCQAFEKGIIDTEVKVFDVNSMYPHAMRNFRHPFDNEFYECVNITEETAFIEWRGKNHGAVPVRTKTGLDFTIEYGTFYTTIHEWEAGLETGTIEPEEVIRTVNFTKWTTFEKFVDHFFNLRAIAKAEKNLFYDLFYKLILNSAYGKFAQNPENYKEWVISDGDTHYDGYDGDGCVVQEHMDYILWGKPVEMFNFFNVAVASSITGASRAVMLRGLANTTRPLYCDTDSIICEQLDGVTISATQLGAWDLEATGTRIAISGKKLYALYDGDNCIKLASKGVSLVPRDIDRLMPDGVDYAEARSIAKQKAMNIGGAKIVGVAEGGVYQFVSDAPSFKLTGEATFIKRKVRRT